MGPPSSSRGAYAASPVHPPGGAGWNHSNGVKGRKVQSANDIRRASRARSSVITSRNGFQIRNIMFVSVQF
jgi:hypothetical protein